MAKKLVIGLFFGGRSVEHEVSVITALQAFENLDQDKYEIIPIYVSKEEKFYINEKFLDIKNYQDLDHLLLSSTEVVVGKKNGQGGLLSLGLFSKLVPIDVAFPLFHGSFGEDGAIQGLFEIYQIPYVGLGVTGSSLGMDKVLQKAIYKELGLNVGKYVAFKRSEWLDNPEEILKQVLPAGRQGQDGKHGGLKFPMVVKPATIGSSIGINKASDEDSLSFAIEVASTYADKILVEEAFGQDFIEVNCSALGYGEEIKASVCEMPIASEEVLSFADKYMKGEGKKSSGYKGGGMETMTRVIPAPISQNLTKQIQQATIKIFQAFDGCGVARVDYFVDKEENLPAGRQGRFWVNEINSPPGSLAYYLWEKSGIKFKDLLDLLITYALKRAEDQKKTTYTFESGLLRQMALKGRSKR